MLKTTENRYNGIIIGFIDDKNSDFKKELKDIISKAKEEKKELLWLDLTTKESKYIAISIDLGFKFHNCELERITLIYRVVPDAYIPVPPTHTIGVGAIVINSKNELLMVRDRIHNNHSRYKLPGGMLEPESRLIDGVKREVLEETGIKTKFKKLVSILNAHPYRFNKSNLYIVFELEPLSTEINIIDTNEIELALWVRLDEFFDDKEISTFQKDLVKRALETKGLTMLKNQDNYFKNKMHVEVYG
jgi:ADP-ribose pyrophosphatase YjhB (NUDIX family)